MESTNWDNNWRDTVGAKLIEEFKIDLFDPAKDAKQQWVHDLNKARDEENYDRMREIAKQFVYKDLQVVDYSNFIIAAVPYKIPTTGTAHEIIDADSRKRPTLLVCEKGKKFVPAWYYGIIPHKYFFGSWEDLYAYLRDVDAGLHKDDSRWAYVYGLI
jgi:hypothetical protein